MMKTFTFFDERDVERFAEAWLNRCIIPKIQSKLKFFAYLESNNLSNLARSHIV